MEQANPDNVFPLPVPLLKADEIKPRSADELRARGALGTGGSVQCSATSKGSGQRCKQKAVAGATVCVVHGGRAPQVRRVADAKLEELDVRRQIEALVPAALDTMRKLVVDAKDDKTQLAAAKDVLDRAGHGATSKHEVGGPGSFALLDVDGQIERMLASQAQGVDPDDDTG